MRQEITLILYCSRHTLPDTSISYRLDELIKSINFQSLFGQYDINKQTLYIINWFTKEEQNVGYLSYNRDPSQSTLQFHTLHRPTQLLS